jgi:hypothetical protein
VQVERPCEARRVRESVDVHGGCGSG